jgi:hypothetical protein
MNDHPYSYDYMVLISSKHINFKINRYKCDIYTMGSKRDMKKSWSQTIYMWVSLHSYSKLLLQSHGMNKRLWYINGFTLTSSFVFHVDILVMNKGYV